MNNFAQSFPLLTFIVAVPFVGAALIGLLSNWAEDDRSSKIIGWVASLGTLALTIVLLVGFNRHDDNYQFVSAHKWISDFGIQWKLGVDGISLFLVVLSGLIFPLALWGARVKDNVKAFTAWMLVLEGGCLGSFLSLDLFLFFVFFEIVLVPMYFLIAGWGQSRRRYAAIKFFLYTLTGSAFLFVGILALVFIDAANTGRGMTFDFVQLQQNHAFSNTEARWLFIAFAIAFAVKVPLFPLHTWLGDTYEQSPIAGAIISSAVMVKLGTFGLVRYGVELFPKAAHDMAPLLLVLAVIGMIYGAVIACVQKDLRRIAAYSSLSHLGFIVLGTFAFSLEGLTGAVMQMINHGITAAALFLLIGMIYARRETTFVADLRGLQGPAPVLAAVMTLVVMSSIGVPGLNGFVGEFLILLGTFITHRWWAVVGAIAVVIASVYMLWMYRRVFHGEANQETKEKMFDLSLKERLVMAPLAILIVFFGCLPSASVRPY